jgi:hypothetical protein
MRFAFTGRRLAAGVVGVVIVGLAAGGIAYATIPDSSGVLHGCYSANGANAKGGTQLYLVNSDQATCSNGQTAVPWGQTGPAGQTGPTGPAGPTGPQGPAGPTDIWDLNHYGNGSLSIGVNNSTLVAEIIPPPGTYYVEASLHGFNSNGAADIWCELQVPGTIAWAQGDATEANQNVDLHLQGVGTITSSQNINVTCRSNAAGSSVEDWNLDALKVSNVH